MIELLPIYALRSIRATYSAAKNISPSDSLPDDEQLDAIVHRFERLQISKKCSNYHKYKIAALYGLEAIDYDAPVGQAIMIMLAFLRVNGIRIRITHIVMLNQLKYLLQNPRRGTKHKIIDFLSNCPTA